MDPTAKIVADPAAAPAATPPEIELGGGAAAPGATPGAAGHPEGSDVDLEGAAESLSFSPSALVVSIIAPIIAGPGQISAATGKPPTPQERLAGFTSMLVGDGGSMPGLLPALDFDRNVMALLAKTGVGSNISPGVAVIMGCVAIAGCAFMFRAPRQAKPAVASATPAAATAPQPQARPATAGGTG